MRLACLAVVSAVLAFGLATPPTTTAGAARVLVVSPAGSDKAAGTPSAPMRTIQTAVGRLRSGGVIELRRGVYHQRVRLVGVHALTIRPYQREHATLSGAGLNQDGTSALVTIAQSDDITVRGLDITGLRTAKLGVVPIGVYVHGHGRSIRLVDNHVHDLGNDNNTLGSFDINAHGIAVYGDDPRAAVSELLIAHNTVDNLHLGASESVVVNGNVNHWSISDNDVRDNDNIGIVAIGFEPTLTGKYRYTQANRARNGLIAGNTVARIRSRGNPAYWDDGWCNCADGIYVDGGTHIRIRANHVSDSDIGIEVASENPRGAADHVAVTHNNVHGSLSTGLATGGYCDGAPDCGGVRTGSSHDNTFEYNSLTDNNRLEDGSPELLVQYYTTRNTFEHNTITATNAGHVVYGTVDNARGGTNVSDHNTFSAVGASPAAVRFGWRGRVYLGLNAFRAATGQDLHSTYLPQR